ncbi:MAG: hypothetical protein CVV24_01555 [Ignavibacteriae bacterium HGW-Ignavibacteriae-3]|nr:MAG: hypothetical protein CVV24_01555 [Ignavibacteriae bacterium HGW-Ignavibacteriae-3]
MEIIPFIFTVLEILIGLTLLTLGLSYIINKTKQNKEEEIPQRRVVYSEPLAEQNAAPLLENNFRKQIIESEDSLSAEMKNQKEIKSSKKIHSKKKPEIRDDNPIILNKRVSVMKNLLKTRTADEPAKSVKIITERRDNSLRGDILDKYIEEDNKDLFTLDVKEKKKKTK